MKKWVFSLLAFVMLAPQHIKADEGMWFLMFLQKLNMRDMQAKGLKLSAEEIYSINNSSLKDAIVQFNGGCTAEIISKEGLVLTNHHCGYDVIAELSSPENNYLRDGFWAANRKAELKPKSLFVRFFVRMDNVTDRILALVNDTMSEADREKIINQETAKIQKENDEGGKYVVSVRPFFQGNEYYYFVYQDYTDVRLVGTPTESIGKFGGDTDNWEWPRHTGDFALFRVYADADNNPAAFAESNVPLQPKHHLPINIGGFKEKDFAMILGYPGRTNRWMPAEGIEQNVKFAYPAWVEGSKMSMDKMKSHMDGDDKVRLDYASKYASIANYWKNRQGMIDALSQFKTAEAKRKTEAKFVKWANKKENKAKYGSAVADINKYYALTNEKAKHDNYLMTMLRGSAFAITPARLGNQLISYAKADAAQQKNIKSRLVDFVEGTFEGIYMPLEKDVMAGQLSLYSSKAGTNLAPSVQSLVDNKTDFNHYVNNAFDLSMFTSKERLLAFLELPDVAFIENDPLYKLSSNLLEHYNAKSEDLKEAENNFQRGFRNLVAGLRESKLSPIQYPDANS
ncbi:MAG: S46 family peptidase, partial [Flavobacterium sp.]